MSTVEATTLPDGPPPLPLVYLDWNTVQHLRKDVALSPLLASLANVRLAGAALVPFSVAHLMDATADWTQLAAEHRSERLRDMLFLEGLSSSWMWTIEAAAGSFQHRLSREPVVEACAGRGYFESFTSMDEDLLAEANSKVAADVAAAVAQMREVESSAPKDLVEQTAEVLTELFGDGLRDLSDTGRTFTRLLAPLFQHVARQMPSLDDVPPGEAVARLDAALGAQLPGLSLRQVVGSMVQGNNLLDPDDLGPTVLGWLGYQRDKVKEVRRGAPGLVPDQSHARCALSSAVFLSGERRLPLRVSAWAAYTGRGNGSWPVVLQVKPGDEASAQAAARVVDAFAQRFASVARDLLERLYRSGA
jgi:hypothetical protein